MSIFGSIMSAIFGPSHPAVAAAAAPAKPSQATVAHDQPAATKPATRAASPSPNSATQKPAGTPPSAPAPNVDVGALLDGKNAGKHLDWKHSIVDLMKLLDLDSSLSARQELAKELHFNGDMHDSASMNIWLHKQVMQKLAENGGKVPQGL